MYLIHSIQPTPKDCNSEEKELLSKKRCLHEYTLYEEAVEKRIIPGERAPKAWIARERQDSGWRSERMIQVLQGIFPVAADT